MTYVCESVPCSSPAECYAWLDREQLAQLAQSAYDRACLVSEPPPGEGWWDGGLPWSDRETFARTLLEVLALEIGAHAHHAGLPGYQGDPVRLSLWPDPWQVPTATSGPSAVPEAAEPHASVAAVPTATSQPSPASPVPVGVPLPHGGDRAAVAATGNTPCPGGAVFSCPTGKDLPLAPNGSKSNGSDLTEAPA